jgi:hypothetical protein
MDLNSIYFVVYYRQFLHPINAVTKNVSMNTVKPILINEYKRPGISYLEYDGHDYRPPLTQDLIEHIDFLYKMLGEDMTCNKWCNLSNSEKKSLETDITIKRLLNI